MGDLGDELYGTFPREEILQCARCGVDIDINNQTYHSFSFEKHPKPALEDMEFDDWFVTNYRLCDECVGELEEWLNGSENGGNNEQ